MPIGVGGTVADSWTAGDDMGGAGGGAIAGGWGGAAGGGGIVGAACAAGVACCSGRHQLGSSLDVGEASQSPGGFTAGAPD